MKPSERLDQLRRMQYLRELKDPVRHITLGATQQRARDSRAMFKMVDGPNRSGKTVWGALEIVLAARRLHPTRSSSVNGMYCVFCISREQLRDVWGAKILHESRIPGPGFAQPMIPPEEIKEIRWDQSMRDAPRCIILKNGNRIHFGLSGHQKSWEFLQGKDFILGVCIDEGAGVQLLIDEIVARMLDAIGNHQVEAATGGSWFVWTTTETLINDTHAQFKEKCMSDDPVYKEFEHFRLQPSENPAITVEARERLRGALSEDAFAIRMEGTQGAMGATLIYPQFNPERHVLMEDYEPTPSDNLWLAYDPGVSHPTGMVMVAVSKDAPTTLKVVKCWRHKFMTLDYDLELLDQYLRGRALEGFIYDPASKKRDKVYGESVAGQIRARLTSRGVKINRGAPQAGYNHVLPGINMVRSYLDPPRTWSAAGSPMLVMNPSHESGCRMLQSELVMYRGYPERQYTGAGGVIKKNDDLVDPIRYLVMQRPAWVERPSNPPLWAEGAGPVTAEFDMRTLTEEDIIHAERLAQSARSAGRRAERGRRIARRSRP